MCIFGYFVVSTLCRCEFDSKLVYLFLFCLDRSLFVMPRRSSNKNESPVPRRQSARIAAASANKTPASPVKKTRRSKVIFLLTFMCLEGFGR